MFTVVERRRNLLELIIFLPGLKLLEIGCGGGILTEPLCRLGAGVTAIDLSAQSVAVAESRLENAGNHLVKQVV